MKKQKQLAWIIAFSLTTGNLSFVQAQSAADFEDAEYYASGGLDLINAAAAYAAGYTGKGVTLGICVTPVNFLSPEFNQKKASFMVNQAKMYGGEPGVYDWRFLNHGTHVAGIAAADRNGLGMQGVACEAEIAGSVTASEYLEDGTRNKDSQFYEYYLSHPEIKVVNDSWGSAYYLDSSYTDGLTAAHRLELLQDLASDDSCQQILNAAGQGKLLVFAAANSGHTGAALEPSLASLYAAASHNILSVTNLNGPMATKIGHTIQVKGNLLRQYTNMAKYVEDQTLTAPGTDIFSANADFETDGKLDVLKSGTSMAAPFVTGTGALVQQAFPYLDSKQIGDVLLSTANTDIMLPSAVQACIQSENKVTSAVNLFYVDGNTRTEEQILADQAAYYDANTLFANVLLKQYGIRKIKPSGVRA